MAHGRLEPIFVYVLWVHCDIDLMIFLEGKGKSKKSELWSGRLPTCWTAAATHFYWKSPLGGKVHALQSPNAPSVAGKGQSPTTLSEVYAVQSPTLSKKKKSKFGGNLTRSGVRVRGLGLVCSWTSAAAGCPDPVRSRPASDTFFFFFATPIRCISTLQIEKVAEGMLRNRRGVGTCVRAIHVRRCTGACILSIAPKGPSVNFRIYQNTGMPVFCSDPPAPPPPPQNTRKLGNCLNVTDTCSCVNKKGKVKV